MTQIMSSYTTSKEYCIAQTVLSPTSFISVSSIIPTPNTADNNGDVFVYIYGLSVGIVLLIIIIIIVIISVIYIIKYHTRSEFNILYIVTYSFHSHYLFDFIAKPTSEKREYLLSGL